MALATTQGTGTTTGPYYPVANTLISLNDPVVYSQSANSLQIQNNSTFVLSVQSSGASYTIMPLTASTIPSSGGQTITVFPTYIGYVNNTAGVYVVWLLPGQNAPIQDGPLVPYTPAATPTPVSHALTVTSGNSFTITGFLTSDIQASFSYTMVSFLSWPPNSYAWLVTTNGQVFGPGGILAQSGSGTLSFSVSGVTAATTANIVGSTNPYGGPNVPFSNLFIASCTGTAHNQDKIKHGNY